MIDVPVGRTLDECFEKFREYDTLDENNMYNCRQCGNLTRINKKIDIYRCPPVLIVHLKRFKRDTFGGYGSYKGNTNVKIDSHVDFPLNFDMKKYVTGPGKFQPMKNDDLNYECYAV